jgi:virulence factor
MRIAIIGLGDIARKAYLPILATREDLDIFLFSRSETSVQKIQAQYRLPNGSTDLVEVIRNHPLAAFVLTPKETHFEIVQQLLKAGIDVFVEKPATLHSTETCALAEEADRRGRVLMVGFNRRFAPLHIKGQELITGQSISLGIFKKNRLSDSDVSFVEQLTEDTIHQIDLLRFYCGEGEVVSTIYQALQSKLISATSTVSLEKGGIAVLATCLQAGAWNESYSLFGSKKSIFIDAFAQLRLVTPDEEKKWKEGYSSSWMTTLEGRGFTGQINHFLECVKKREQPKTSGWDSVKTQQLVEDMVEKAIIQQ